MLIAFDTPEIINISKQYQEDEVNLKGEGNTV